MRQRQKDSWHCLLRAYLSSVVFLSLHLGKASGMRLICERVRPQNTKRHRLLQALSPPPPLAQGIVRQRFLDMATDTLRAALLRLAGYDTDVVEFVPTEHTPRNLLIRAVLRRPEGIPARATPVQRRSSGSHAASSSAVLQGEELKIISDKLKSPGVQMGGDDGWQRPRPVRVPLAQTDQTVTCAPEENLAGSYDASSHADGVDKERQQPQSEWQQRHPPAGAASLRNVAEDYVAMRHWLGPGVRPHLEELLLLQGPRVGAQASRDSACSGAGIPAEAHPAGPQRVGAGVLAGGVDAGWEERRAALSSLLLQAEGCSHGGF
jgi:hypothetical protein